MSSNKLHSFLIYISLVCLLIVFVIQPLNLTVAKSMSDLGSVRGKPQGRLFEKKIFSKTHTGSKDAFILGTTLQDGTVDWKTIFMASSISSISPILIVENKDSIDDVSPKLFLEQYNPEKVYVHNYILTTQAGVQLEENINAQLYSWANFVVVTDGNNYAKSLSAASFAAYYNIPLFFTPLREDEKNLIAHWGAETIGIETAEHTDHPLTISQSLELLKKKSDYVILTTSDDLNASVRPRFSLAVPILAGGRKAVVFNIKNPTRESVKRRIDQETRGGFKPAYLVIVGSEKNFPFLQFDIVAPETFYNQDDDHQYFVNLYYWANYDTSNEYYADAATGAMTGYSLGDISALIARSVFYNKIASSNKIVQWSPFSSSYEKDRQGASFIGPVLDPVFSKKYISNFKNFDSLDVKDNVVEEIASASVFIYNGHSSRNVLGNMMVNEIPLFKNPTFIFALGCAALEPWNPGTTEDELNLPIVAYDAIRKGAVGIEGNAEISISAGTLFFGTDSRNAIETVFKKPVGDSIFLVRHFHDAMILYQGEKPKFDGPSGPKSYTYLLGDPKLKLKLKGSFSPLVISANKLRLDIIEKYIMEKFAMRDSGFLMPILCRIFEKDCKNSLRDGGRSLNIPLLLDSYIFNVDPGASTQKDAAVLPMAMSLRFFTTIPLTGIDVVPHDSNYYLTNPPEKYFGKHCFNLGKKRFCPNFISTEYGKILFSGPERTITIQMPNFIDFIFEH